MTGVLKNEKSPIKGQGRKGPKARESTKTQVRKTLMNSVKQEGWSRATQTRNNSVLDNTAEKRGLDRFRTRFGSRL